MRVFEAIGVERWDQRSAGLSGGGASRSSARDPKSPGQEIKSQDHRPQIRSCQRHLRTRRGFAPRGRTKIVESPTRGLSLLGVCNSAPPLLRILLLTSPSFFIRVVHVG